MKKQKGSALIIVLIIVSFVAVLGTSLANVTYSEKLMSKSYNNSSAAYYVAEAGMERSIAVINNAMKTRLESIRIAAVAQGESDKLTHTQEELQTDLEVYIRDEVDRTIKDYFIPSNLGSFDKQISSCKTNDATNLTSQYGLTSYYNVTASVEDTRLTATPVQRRTVIIESTGYYGDSIRTIRAKYYIQDTESVTVRTVTTTYPDLFVFLQNAINGIGLTAISDIANHTTVDGNVLILGSVADLQTHYSNIGGDIYVKANTVQFGSKTSIPHNIILDISNVDMKSGMTVGGYIYSSLPISHLQYRSINSCTLPYLVTDGYGNKHIGDFEIKQITNFSMPAYTPPGLKYIYLPSGGTLDPSLLSSDSTVYNVVISGGDLIIDKALDFKGLIYCTGVLEVRNHVEIDGVVMAYDLNANKGNSNHLVVNHNLPTGTLLDHIIDTIRASVRGDLEAEIILKPYNLLCQDWSEN